MLTGQRRGGEGSILTGENPELTDGKRGLAAVKQGVNVFEAPASPRATEDLAAFRATISRQRRSRGSMWHLIGL